MLFVLILSPLPLEDIGVILPVLGVLDASLPDAGDTGGGDKSLSSISFPLETPERRVEEADFI